MKISIVKLLLLFCLSYLSIVSLPVQAAAETFIIDPQHSYIQWRVNHLGFSTQTGKWYINGTITLDKDKPQASKVAITIKIADMVTGIPDLDKHLKDKLFFNVAQYPIANFVSNKVDVIDNTNAIIHGTLAIHGVSKPISLPIKLNKVGKNPINDKLTVGFSANTKLKRSDYGISTFIPSVGDEVTINIEVEAYQDKKQ